MTITQILTPSRVLAASLALLTLIFLVYVGIRTRVDPLEAAMEKNEPVGLLLVIHEGQRVLLAGAIYLHPQTGRLFGVVIPPETGALIPSLSRVAAIADIFDSQDPHPYRDQVQALLDHPLAFVLPIDLTALERTVDLLGGLTLQLNEPLERREGDEIILVPSGAVRLEGPKIVQYLRYSEERETISDRADRNQRLLQALLRQIGDESLWLTHPDALHQLQRIAFSRLEEDGLKLWVEFLGKADIEGMVFLRVLGNIQTVDGKPLLFPHFNGNLLREGVQQAVRAISSPERESLAAMNIKLEILNGTDRAGLASRTASLYRSVGIDVVRIDNADHRNYVHTLVLDRKGNLAVTQRVAELIRATQIRSDLSTYDHNGVADVTLILGLDFDGRYVRQ